MNVLPIIILLPLLSAVLSPLLERSRLLYHLISGVLALTNVVLLLEFLPKEQELRIGNWIYFIEDKYGWLFALAVNVAWFITVFYSYNFSKFHFQRKAAQFYANFGFVTTVILANGFSGNLYTLFLFYVIGIPITYPLIVNRQTKEALEGGRAYLLYTLLPAFFLFLPAIVWVTAEMGFVDFGEKTGELFLGNDLLAGFVLTLFILGISKNAVMPFHNWLPKTMQAPAPISALVHSVAAVKSGSIAVIKIVVYVYGLDRVRELTNHFFTGGWLFYLLGITAVYAAWKAYKTNNLKKRFSYSTISQLSYILSAVLVATPLALVAALMHVVTHGIAKIGLFYIAGFFNNAYNTLNTGKIADIAPYHKPLVAAVGLFGLSIIGFPFMAGFYSKDMMLLEQLHTHNYSAATFLVVGSIINIFYIHPIIKAGFFTKEVKPLEEVKKVPIGFAIAIVLCLLVTMTFSLYAYDIMHIVE